ncbi:VOC family protein [Nitratireductor basaltis]|uniref:Glyoxalase/bleomycin resistance protein/dioxygenase n=1 Tax=Nitratireductor basaltis TaxID=472175 RepID=A0A084UCV2_9HYPH|nr:VOC family protein [Nitratireductor basaltis]KFB10788.1 Glyoxalase/bleomycin resistance protein/dioxygenase [Nitratireductor basaltis]
MPKHGTFVWNELMTHDVKKAKAFYADTVGWSFEAMDMGEGTYHVAKTGDDMAAGFFEMSGPDFENVPDHWMPYLEVDGIDGLVKKAEGKGATIIRQPFDVPGVGRIAIIKEPTGAVVGWMTSENR